MNLKSINCVILNFLLAFCLNISFAQDQKITPLSKDSKSVEKPKKGTLKSSVSINPDELVYTGIIYIKCGKELREVKRAALPRKLLTFGSDRKVSKVDVAGFKTAMNYKPTSLCKEPDGAGKEYFFISLTKDANIQGKSHSRAIPTNCAQEMTKDCNLERYAKNCSSSIMCSCEGETYGACGNPGCKDMVMICPDFKED
ncbi:MAG: hypothetical protein KA251_08375 [Saprospiraceae bacterium]|nr:hypothetical protein [Candidatus Vicinibacter affinis]MBP6522994.1 hypothetical protein [Saprospiraceae bacterium]